MPRKPTFPKFSVRRDGMAYVTVGGQRIYLGQHDGPRAQQRYQTICARISAGITDTVLAAQFDDERTIYEIIARFLDHAQGYYSDGEYNLLNTDLERFGQFYGAMAADQFGPKALIDYRDGLAKEKRRVRKSINATIGRVKRMWKWAASQELCDPMMHHKLSSVPGLRHGQHGCPESSPVPPACPDAVRGILPLLPPTIAAMVQTQYLCGMRPGEVCIIRQADIHRTDGAWLYIPESHKNQWRGHDLIKAIPRTAQRIISPLLTKNSTDYLFRPVDTHRWAREQLAKNSPARKTKRYPCETKRVENAKRQRAKSGPKFKPCYTPQSYNQAIKRTFEAATAQGMELQRFTPNQLRHQILTDVTDLIGEAAAQKFAGHKHVSSTRIYTQKQLEQRSAELMAIADQLDRLWAGL